MATSQQQSVLPEQFNRTGMVARWQPVHLGHTPVLRALCERSEHTLIGIGSSNRYNLRNPFTLEETEAMLRLVLRDRENYTLISVPDLDDGPRWRVMVKELFGPLDVFITENPYVANLMEDQYPIMRPVWLVPPEERIPLDGSMVRKAMAQGDHWQTMVPPEIAAYITEREIDKRFRREFGLQTLALKTVVKKG